MSEDRNPLGEFLDDSEDAGSLCIGFDANHGHVVLDFDRRTQCIGFTPDQAEDLGRALVEAAHRARELISRAARGVTEEEAKQQCLQDALLALCLRKGDLPS